jgi:hypothetical protein
MHNLCAAAQNLLSTFHSSLGYYSSAMVRAVITVPL